MSLSRSRPIPPVSVKRAKTMPRYQRSTQAKVSPKRLAMAPARAKCIAAVRKRSGGFCEVRLPGCATFAAEVHEKLMRSHGGDITDPGVCLDTCRPCHRAIHENPAASYADGLLIEGNIVRDSDAPAASAEPVETLKGRTKERCQMALRAKKPEAVQKRLKLFMFGPAGVGKTTAAIQFPNSYVIDCEKGSENYGELITANGGAVYHTVDVHEAIAEVKSLLSEKHDFRTLVIDPITPLYNDLLEKMEGKVGSDFGRHYGAANKEMKRLANLIMALDMNVIVTAHAKVEYGENLKKLGHTFDGWKSLDYWFDLVLQLSRSKNFDGPATKVKGNQRFARVEKSRIKAFPDLDIFEWNYATFEERYGAETLGREAIVVPLATPGQVAEINALIEVVKLPDGLVEKWFGKANVDCWEDMPQTAIGNCLEYIKSRFPSAAAPAKGKKELELAEA